MSEQEVIRIFKALSVESRVQILKLVKDKPKCVNAITSKLNISQPAVSQHLAVLKDAGLVRGDRYGSIVHYLMDKNRLDDFKRSIVVHLGKEFILLSE